MDFILLLWTQTVFIVKKINNTIATTNKQQTTQKKKNQNIGCWIHSVFKVH